MEGEETVYTSVPDIDRFLLALTSETKALYKETYTRCSKSFDINKAEWAAWKPLQELYDNCNSKSPLQYPDKHQLLFQCDDYVFIEESCNPDSDDKYQDDADQKQFSNENVEESSKRQRFSSGDVGTNDEVNHESVDVAMVR